MTQRSSVAVPPNGWLSIDAAEWRGNYDRQPFTIAHDLAEHPLLQFDAICELVARFPEDLVEHNLGDIPEVFGDGQRAPRLDEPPIDVARNIERNGSWMVLKYVMQDPAYGVLCNQVLDQIGEVLGSGHDVANREAYIFLSGAASVTPAHCDPEHNFLLQARGTKEFTVGEPPDAKSGERFLEEYYRHGQRNTPFAPAQASKFGLAPGVGIYVPPHRPHLVKSRSELTISLSVTWRPRDLRREGRVYAFNARRRERGRQPRPVGASPLLDLAKSTFEGVCSRARRAFGRQRSAGYG